MTVEAAMPPASMKNVLAKLFKASEPAAPAQTWSKQEFRQGMAQLLRDKQSTQRTELALNEHGDLAQTTYDGLGNVISTALKNPDLSRTHQLESMQQEVIPHATPLDIKKLRNKFVTTAAAVAIAGSSAMQMSDTRPSTIEFTGSPQPVVRSVQTEDPIDLQTRLRNLSVSTSPATNTNTASVSENTATEIRAAAQPPPAENIQPMPVIESLQEYVKPIDGPIHLGGVNGPEIMGPTEGTMTLPDGSVRTIVIAPSNTLKAPGGNGELTLIISKDGIPIGFVHSGISDGEAQLGEFITSAIEGNKQTGVFGPEQMKNNIKKFIASGASIIITTHGKSVRLRPTDIDYIQADDTNQEVFNSLFGKNGADFKLSMCGRNGPQAIAKYMEEFKSSQEPAVLGAVTTLRNPDATAAQVDEAFMKLYSFVKQSDKNKAALMLLEYKRAAMLTDQSGNEFLQPLNFEDANKLYKQLLNNPDAPDFEFYTTRYVVSWDAEDGQVVAPLYVR